MVAEVLVDRLVDDGRGLLADLHRDGFRVAAAAWLHDAERGRWHLHLVLPGPGGGRMGDALDRVYDSLKRLSPTELRFDHIRLAWSDEPLGVVLRSVAERTSRRPARDTTRLRWPNPTLPDYDDALIYPPVGRMSPREVAKTVGDMLGSGVLDQPTGDIGPGGVAMYPRATIERGGRVLHLKPTGVRLDETTGRLMVDARDPVAGGVEHIPADEITDIRLQ